MVLGDEAALDAVQRHTNLAIRKLFGEGHEYLREFTDIYFPDEHLYREEEFKKDWLLSKQKLINLLATMLKEIELFGLFTATGIQPVSREVSKRVFISHGHDAEMKEEARAFITKVGLEPVVLDERPNEGRTVIEKLEHYSAVSFAVILFSPDDFAYSRRHSPSEIKSRVRQNVVLELGYFVAKLGRKNVAVLLKKGKRIEKPSMFEGMMYVAYDDLGAWRHSLAVELQASGHEIDTSRLFEMDLKDLDVPF